MQEVSKTQKQKIVVLTPKEASEDGKVILTEGNVEIVGEKIVPEEIERDKELYSRSSTDLKEGKIIDGTVIAVQGNDVMVDIGFKSEGILSRDEFSDGKVSVGENVKVFLEALEDENGQVVISKKKADFIQVWDSIREAYENKKSIEGKIKKRIKGGMVVDLMGVDAFLPGSQIALRPVPDFDELVGETMEFRVIKLNKMRRNIVVSHRIILEEKRESQRQSLLEKITEGAVIEGVVKNITDFGVFIDLGGMDGLLHITDMSWTRINHPSEMVKINDKINVKILKYDREKQRISLGLKQLVPSPWENVEERFPVGSKIKGKVVNLTKYGAFIRLDEGVEGLIHVSEMSWTKHINHPSEILEVGQEIECVVLDVDKESHKISLGLKQLEPNPWEVAAEKYPKGTRVSGVVRNLTAFGAFVEIEEGIEGLIHISDISWTRRVNHPSEFFKRGQKIEAVVLEIDPENHRIALGYKQLEEDPWPELSKKYSDHAETEGKIIHMTDRGVIVELPDGVEGFVPVTQLGKRVDRPQDAFNEGDILPLKVIEFEPEDRRIVLSVNAYFESRDQQDLERYLAAHPTKTIQLGEVAKVMRSKPKDEE
ncbi:30S ribosomal protein S1 [bacterium]|nr:MAG: 30S ribosomal protein S1 [bacterium]